MLKLCEEQNGTRVYGTKNIKVVVKNSVVIGFMNLNYSKICEKQSRTKV